MAPCASVSNSSPLLRAAKCLQNYLLVSIIVSICLPCFIICYYSSFFPCCHSLILMFVALYFPITPSLHVYVELYPTLCFQASSACSSLITVFYLPPVKLLGFTLMLRTPESTPCTLLSFLSIDQCLSLDQNIFPILDIGLFVVKLICPKTCPLPTFHLFC